MYCFTHRFMQVTKTFELIPGMAEPPFSTRIAKVSSGYEAELGAPGGRATTLASCLCTN